MLDIRDEGIKSALDTIFSAVLAGGLDPTNVNEIELMRQKLKMLSYFVGNFKARFPMQVFVNEYAVFYEFITKQNSTVFTLSSLRTVVEANFDNILDSPYIDLSGYNFTSNNGATTKEEKLYVYYEDLADKFKQFSARIVEKEEFESACNIYISWFKEEFMRETSNNMALIMSDTGFDYRKPGRRIVHLKGNEDAQKYYNERVAVLRSLDEESAVIHTVYTEEEYNKDMSTTTSEDAILDYGIDEIDSVKGKMRRGNMVEVIGPTKGGKTTLTTFFVERALSQGLNVAIWPLEGTADEWKSLIIALMVRLEPSNNGMVVDKKNVLMKTYTSEEERQAVEAARLALAVNKDRGRLSFIDGAAYVEDFEDVLKYHFENENPFDVIVMDSPVNIMSRTGKNRVERISECYMCLKAFVSKKMKRKALCLCTAQIKQNVVDYIRSHPDEELDVTAGGESAETIRTPDEVIGVFSTKAEREANRMKLYSVASRHNKDFRTSYIYCELGCGYFKSQPDLNE